MYEIFINRIVGEVEGMAYLVDANDDAVAVLKAVKEFKKQDDVKINSIEVSIFNRKVL